jgi:hypothetical protein
VRRFQNSVQRSTRRCLEKYYWNQTIYFDLIQGINLSSLQGIKVKKKSKKYYVKIGKRQLIHFEK